MLELLFEQRPAVAIGRCCRSVFGKTPRGRQLTSAAREVNHGAARAARPDAGGGAPVGAGPSRHTLVIETDRCRLTLELDSAGARVASLETG